MNRIGIQLFQHIKSYEIDIGCEFDRLLKNLCFSGRGHLGILSQVECYAMTIVNEFKKKCFSFKF